MPNSVDRSKTLERLAGDLRAARARKGMTQEQVARIAGTGVNKVSLIETGTVDPRLSTLARIATALELRIIIEGSAA